MAFPPLENYGLIGNRETCALVGSDGSVDWFCYPHLDSSSVFARLLDEDGGHFSIRPTGEYRPTQRYLPRTNVVETTFETARGTLALTDFMPAVDAGPGPNQVSQSICRKVVCTDGSVEFRLEFAPRFDYGRSETTLDVAIDGAVARSDEGRLAMSSDISLSVEDSTAVGTKTLEAGEEMVFPLQYGMRLAGDAVDCPDVDYLLDRTVAYWRQWAHDCDDHACPYDGPWHDLAVRSSLVLKLLQNWMTGAIAAAPTTSLPEKVGGVRNWDYRFNWIRDSAFVVQSLYRMGYEEEARQYHDWLLNLPDFDHPSSMQPVYGLHGESDLTERTLTHMSGYRNSTPVRIGNAAHRQLQLDVYGELVLGVHETSRQGELLTPDQWNPLRNVIDHVAGVWDRKDLGIWEVRDRPRHMVHSKVMCWAALDRGVRMAERWDLEASVDRWRAQRERVRERVLEEGYDEANETFVRAFDDNGLDAATLQLPLVGFLPADDPKIRGTIEAVENRLLTPDGLVYRYEGDDGIGGEENPFVLCSFWLVDCLALSGRVAEARDLFERILEFGGSLGLFGEEINPKTAAHRGNFPQAFSHLGLIDSVRYLNEASEGVVETEPFDERPSNDHPHGGR